MILFVALLSTALATGVRSDTVPCPFGNGTVKRFYKVSTNTMGGYDSDLAAYSTRGQFRAHAISTCPDNFFSILGNRLDVPILERDSGAIQSAIDEARLEWRNRDQPTVWERYDTAARIGIALGQDPLEIADLYLNAAWTVRDVAVGVYVGGLNGPEAARQIITVGNQELTKNLTSDAQKMVHYNLARVAHRGGFAKERRAHIQAFLALPSPTPEERAAGERLKQMSASTEVRYQERAASLLKAALKQSADPVRVARAEYQLADTLRRLERFEEAKTHFESVRDNANAPEQLRELSRYLLTEFGDL